MHICFLSQAFGNPSVKLNDQEEKTRGFVQLVSMLLLLFTVSVVEIHRGEIEVGSQPACRGQAQAAVRRSCS